MCGERGYAALSIYFTPVLIEDNPGMPDLIGQGAALADAAVAAGRDPDQARRDWRICREVYVSDCQEHRNERDPREPAQLLRLPVRPGLAALMKRDAQMPDADVTFEWMVENIPWIIGSPAEVVDQIRELDEAVGGFGTLLFNSREWVATDRWYRSLELFARYVIPAFRSREHQAFRRDLAIDALGG